MARNRSKLKTIKKRTEVLAKSAKKMASTSDQLSQEVTCRQCHKLYIDPKLLPCLHVFCRTCLTTRDGPRDKEGLKFQVDCPLCSEVTEVRTDP